MKSRNTILSALFLCFLTLLPMMAQAGNLISIIIADTKDSSIGDSVDRDFTNMRSKTAEIAKYTKMKEVKVHLRDSEANPQRLSRILDELKVNKDDVVVFFYAGHGFHPRAQKKSTPWPSMTFSSGGKSISYDSVMKGLEQKKPRLLLTVADTCNSLTRGLEDNEGIRASPKVDSYVLEHNYKQLFVETTGSIKVTSSSVGESAWGGRSGGIFTNAFINNLNAAVESRNGIDWKVILEKTSKKTTQETANKNSPQHPYYELKIKS